MPDFNNRISIINMRLDNLVVEPANCVVATPDSYNPMEGPKELR